MAINKKKQIVKNTVHLYVRSAVTLIVALYTSRLILHALGVEEFGVYQLVGGIVTALSFLNSTMTSSVQRYLSFEIGIGNKTNINRTFCTLVNVQFVFSILLFLIIMIVGCVLLQNSLDIGKVSIVTARWILFFSCLSLFFTVNSIPYNSVLIAFEDMKIFAYIDIVIALMKLGIVVLLFMFNTNRLILYAFLMFVVTLIGRIIYTVVCLKKYGDVVKYKFIHDSKLVKRIFTFSGWMTLPAFTYMFRSQGLAIISNAFFGPLLNAAYGIAMQVDSAIRQFIQGFQMAYGPNITKYYAIGDVERMNKVIYTGAKVSTILNICLAVPLCLEIDYILNLWLGQIPPYASIIVRIILVQSIVLASGCNSNSAIQATEKVKWPEITCNLVELSILPLSIVTLYCGANYYIPFTIAVIDLFVVVIIRLLFVKKYVNDFDIKAYIVDIYIKNLMCLFFAIIPSLFIIHFFECSILRVILSTSIFLGILLPLFYIFSTKSYEREAIKELLFNKAYTVARNKYL